MCSLPLDKSVPGRRLRFDSRRRRFPDFRDLHRSRRLPFLSSRRDIAIRYRRTVFDVIWVVVSQQDELYGMRVDRPLSC